MNFLSYLKDRLYIIISVLVIISLVVFIMTLDTWINKYTVDIGHIVYAYILGLALLFLSLTIDYYLNKKRLYDILNKAREEKNLNFVFSLPKKLIKEDRAYEKLFLELYENYSLKLKKYEDENKIRKDFNSLWVHQMKTPVSVMKLLLEEDVNSINILSLSEELEKISNGLNMDLYSHRVNDFEKDLKIEEVNLKSLVREVINENKNTFIINDIYPKISLDEKIYIKTDIKWMKFSLAQIIQNSLKYTKVKDITPKKIEIYIEDSSEGFVLKIKDNGVGIAKKDLNRLFDPFFTGENGRKYSESTGMGLYLTNIVLEKLGYKLSIDSIEGEFSIASIEFSREKNIYKL